jgi:Reverse transcriptase (RNA-dependent DNA polymerase)
MSIAVSEFCCATAPRANASANASPTPMAVKTGARKHRQRDAGMLSTTAVFIALLPITGYTGAAGSRGELMERVPDALCALRRLSRHHTLGLPLMTRGANGKRGVPQGGVISPLLSNLYLTDVDRMLERAKETTRNGKYTYIEYARFADDRAPRRREKEAVM